jgi:hypothetical protein
VHKSVAAAVRAAAEEAGQVVTDPETLPAAPVSGHG